MSELTFFTDTDHSGSIKIQRLTTAVRIAVVNPAEGRIVYDTDENTMYIGDGTNWKFTSNASGFGSNDLNKVISYSLVAGDYGSSNDKTILYTGPGGHIITNLDSTSLVNGDYVFIEHRGAGLLEVVFANPSDTIGPVAVGKKNIFLSPGEVIRLQRTGTLNEWRMG